MQNRKRFIKIISTILCTAMLSSFAAGCSKKNENTPSPAVTNDTTSTVTSNDSYPLKTDVTLKYWYSWSHKAVKSYNEAPFAIDLNKKTGVKVEYINPPAGTAAKDAFSIMIASGDLPDIIEYDWANTYPGGPESAINNKIILKLNDIIEQYSPNLSMFYKENPDRKKPVMTDSGSLYCYPFFRSDIKQLTYAGLVIRKDWLNDLGLQVPTTVDEWEKVLTEFKEKKGAQAPLTFYHDNGKIYGADWGAFTGAYGVIREFYMEDNKIKFGPMEKGYKDFLTLFRKWYSQGLLDKNFATVDWSILDANISGGKSGATTGMVSGGIGKYLDLMKDKDPKFDMVAAPYPVLKKGDKPKFGQRENSYGGGSGPAITTKCKNVEIAARFLDYGYSEEGKMFFNFGTEGVTYKMENGYPKFTDLINNNSNGLTQSDALFLYVRNRGNGPSISDVRLGDQQTKYPQQIDARKIWSDTDADKHILPPISASPEESSELAKIMNDINTYVNEMTLKFILGNTSLDEFDKYVEQIKKMNIEKAIKIKTDGVDRYNKR